MSIHLPFRVGYGYDIHQLVVGRKCILGGVEIPHTKGLLGHSDADCLSHAIADALLGSCALPDIGHYFPNTDPKWKGADSQVILHESYEEVLKLGYTLGNIDATVIAQSPKIGPHIQSMKAVLAQTLDVTPEQIGIKATTNEHIGALGKGEGIAACATCLVFKK